MNTRHSLHYTHPFVILEERVSRVPSVRDAFNALIGACASGSSALIADARQAYASALVTARKGRAS